MYERMHARLYHPRRRASARLFQLRRRANPRQIILVEVIEAGSRRFGPGCDLRDDHPRLTYAGGKFHQRGKSSVLVFLLPVNYRPTEARPHQKLSARVASSPDGDGVKGSQASLPPCDPL
jgi:hypothetical protein